MNNEQEILSRLAEISSGIRDINTSISKLEGRIAEQEKKSRKTVRRQVAQGREIEKLKKIVRDIADSDGIKRYDGAAIRREPAYAEFEKNGIGKRAAMKELKDAGVIKADSEGKSTCVIRLDGKLQRVIIVCEAEG